MGVQIPLCGKTDHCFWKSSEKHTKLRWHTSVPHLLCHQYISWSKLCLHRTCVIALKPVQFDKWGNTGQNMTFSDKIGTLKKSAEKQNSTSGHSSLNWKSFKDAKVSLLEYCWRPSSSTMCAFDRRPTQLQKTSAFLVQLSLPLNATSSLLFTTHKVGHYKHVWCSKQMAHITILTTLEYHTIDFRYK